MLTLEGKVVIITGASAGIGREAARCMAENGANILIAARRDDRIGALEREIINAGGQAVAVRTDISLPENRARLVSEALDRWGRVDVLVNNAGFGIRGPLELIPMEKIRSTFETNVLGTIALTQLVIPVMRRQRSGRIINISSVAGRIASPMSSVYDATKHALEAISDGLRGELAPWGIDVVVVQPGYTATEFLEASERLFHVEGENPYENLLATRRVGEARLRQLAAQPADIARLIHHVATVESPAFRYAAPRFARAALALKRFLPEKAFDWLMNCR